MYCSFICTFLLDITGTCPCTAVLYAHYQHSHTAPLLGVWICVDVLEVGFVFPCHSLTKTNEVCCAAVLVLECFVEKWLGKCACLCMFGFVLM